MLQNQKETSCSSKWSVLLGLPPLSPRRKAGRPKERQMQDGKKLKCISAANMSLTHRGLSSLVNTYSLIENVINVFAPGGQSAICCSFYGLVCMTVWIDLQMTAALLRKCFLYDVSNKWLAICGKVWKKSIGWGRNKSKNWGFIVVYNFLMAFDGEQ